MGTQERQRRLGLGHVVDLASGAELLTKPAPRSPTVVTTPPQLLHRPGGVHKLQLQLPAACNQSALITGLRCRRPDPVNTGAQERRRRLGQAQHDDLASGAEIGP